MKQLLFFKENQKSFGGELLKGKRKERRPLSIKKPTHLVLRADISKSGSLFKHRKFLDLTLQTFAQKFNVKVYREGLVYNHVHLMVKFKSIENYKSFIRALSGVLAKKLKIRWEYRPFTRIVEWGLDFKRACGYVLKNELEAVGIIPYTERKNQKRRLKPNARLTL